MAFMKQVLPPLSRGCGEGTAALRSQPSRLARMSECHQAGSGAGLAGTAALFVGEGALLLAASPLAPPLGALPAAPAALTPTRPVDTIEAQLFRPPELLGPPAGFGTDADGEAGSSPSVGGATPDGEDGVDGEDGEGGEASEAGSG